MTNNSTHQPSQPPSWHVDLPTNLCFRLANHIASLQRQKEQEGKRLVLGLATGSSPLPLYRALISLVEKGMLSFQNITTFNLDEYIGLSDTRHSYETFMWDNLFSHVDIEASHIHLVPRVTTLKEAHQAAADYEEAIANSGGIDLQILGIGRNGHIGFNEPGAPADSQTRVVQLDPVTRKDASEAFGGLDHVPTHAISMGIQTILRAREIHLLAWGSAKATAVHESIYGPVGSDVPASFLQTHADTSFHLDSSAATGIESMTQNAVKVA